VLLDIEGDSIWDAVGEQIPSFVLTTVRSMFLPLKLCPTSLDSSQFRAGSTSFQIDVSLGGTNPRVLHTTIDSLLAGLSRKNPSVGCAFKIPANWLSFTPKRRLFTVQITTDHMKTLLGTPPRRRQ